MAHIEPLSSELQKVAIDELNEVPERISEDLKMLRTWIEQQPHLNACLDDRFLIQFLRGCKYSMEKAKDKIDNYHALRTKYPDILGTPDIDSAKFRELFNMGVFTALPTPLHGNGPRLICYRFIYSTTKFRLEDVMQILNAMNDVLMVSDPYACINGIAYIMDLGNATANHFLQYTPTSVKRIMTFYEKTLPLRIKKLIYINASTAAEQFFKIMFPVFSEKLRKRIHICGKDLSALKDDVPLKYFPTDYGGSNGSLDQLTKDYNKVWDEYRDYFKTNRDYGTDERLRPGKPIDFDSIFGTGGTFRKIAVD